MKKYHNTNAKTQLEGQMTHEKMRVIIAEHCGKSCRKCEGTGILKKFRPGEYEQLKRVWIAQGADKPLPMVEPELTCKHCELPDYLNDLNACAEMESTLGENGRDRCYSIAWKLARERVKDPYTPMVDAGWSVYNATAPQRCEAFLRTIGKWENDK